MLQEQIQTKRETLVIDLNIRHAIKLREETIKCSDQSDCSMFKRCTLDQNLSNFTWEIVGLSCFFAEVKLEFPMPEMLSKYTEYYLQIELDGLYQD